jgi:predicted outer membrane protein
MDWRRGDEATGCGRNVESGWIKAVPVAGSRIANDASPVFDQSEGVRMFISNFNLARVLAVAVVAAPTFVWAQSSMDKKFVNDAALGGMTEVALGKVSEKNAASPAVKNFGMHMVDDHSKANDELSQIASAKGMTPPSGLDAPHQKVVDHLSQLKGADFDRAFMSQMLTDHRKTIALFKQEAASAKDPQLKAFAQKTLPTLESHLQMAQQADKVATSK